MHRVACPGSFDPVTNGHLDIIGRAARLHDEVVVVVGANLAKQGLFTVEERVEMLHEVTADIKNVEIGTFTGLLVDYCKANQVTAIVKGLRAVSDFEYEMEMAQMNYRLAEVETLFIDGQPGIQLPALQPGQGDLPVRRGRHLTGPRPGAGAAQGPAGARLNGPGPARRAARPGVRARAELGIPLLAGRLTISSVPNIAFTMPQPRKNSPARLDPRKPLVFSVLDLGRAPGSEHSLTRTVPAPAYAQAGLAGVPEGADVELAVRMEAVSEGVLVTATARAPVTGECARCLEPVHQQVDVKVQELFGYTADDGLDAADGYALQGDLLDLRAGPA